MSKTLIFTATYNEKENIKKLIYDINKLNKNIEKNGFIAYKIIVEINNWEGEIRFSKEIIKNFKN